MSHLATCHCQTCCRARAKEEELYPKPRMPRHLLADWKAKKEREELAESYSTGRMTIRCPNCKHDVKVKISPRITCPACGHTIT